MKMKRKVNKVGINTLTVSLPSKWTEKQGINQGDELEVNENGKFLTITKNGKKTISRRVTLNLDKTNKMIVNRYLYVFYRHGFDEIILTFSKNKLNDYKKGGEILVEKHIKKLVSRFVGLEIISQTKNKMIDFYISPDILASKSNLYLSKQKIIYLITGNKFDLVAKKINTLPDTSTLQSNQHPTASHRVIATLGCRLPH